ncbi:MAG: hypothetical protein JXB39_08735, partial [Deltaproteobacteria bacterium]|nr:hypothetical protein [Deltaproteobacteria bacterium]
MIALLLLAACADEPATDDTGSPASDPWDEPFAWTSADPFGCPPEVPTDDPLVTLLTALGLSLPPHIDRGIYTSYGGYIEDDPARLSCFHALQDDATRVPCAAGTVAAGLDAALASDHPLTAAIAEAAARIDVTLTVGGPLPVPDVQEPLLAALDLLQGDAAWDRAAAEAALAEVPLAVQEAAAALLLVVPEVVEARNAALLAMHPEADAGFLFERLPDTAVVSLESGLDPDIEEDLPFLAPEPGPAAVFYGAGARLAQALDEAPLEAAAGTGWTGTVRVDTPLGLVVLAGDGRDTWDPSADPSLDGPVLLLVDTGGDDVYRIPAGATTDADCPVALHVDLGGDDTYAYVEQASPYDAVGLLPSDEDGRYPGGSGYGAFSRSGHPRQGAGIVGYGFLVDRGGGADTYRSLRLSQGYAALGVGVLADDGGDDAYEAEAVSQAAAMVGIALLLEGGGHDTYRAFTYSQAHAHMASFAGLWDREGNDAYTLVPDTPFVYLWYEGYPHNISQGQGSAQGWRSENYLTDVALGGGVAILRDLAGDDTYTAAVMAQGNGYWFGFGILADAAGDDVYEGYNYVQGATEHFALAAFLEGDGNDTYNPTFVPTHSSVGLGHDFSVTVLVDDAGNDTWFGPDRSLGAGKCHGMGILVDNG